MAPPHHSGWNNLAVQQGKTFLSAVPTQIVSNEEFAPFGQTAEQARVEQTIAAMVEQSAPGLALSRMGLREGTGVVAAALMAMNSVVGRVFGVGEIRVLESPAFANQQGEPYCIFDVQTHYVGSHYDPKDIENQRKGGVSKQALLSLRRRIREAGLNPKLATDTGTLDDLSWRNFQIGRASCRERW